MKKYRFSLKATLMAVFGAFGAFTASAQMNTLYGTMLTNEEWGEDPAIGLYKFDGSVFTPLDLDPNIQANGGGAYINGKYCFDTYMMFMGQMAYNYYLIYDFEAKDYSGYALDPDNPTSIATQVAYDATTGNCYGQFRARRSGYQWGTRDYETGESTKINAMDCSALCALSFDNQGRAWAIDAEARLLNIDKRTGYYTVVGSTGLELNTQAQMSGAFDPASNKFYFIGVTGSETIKSTLYTIDLATGKATAVCDLPGNATLAGTYFMPATYAKEVPAAPTDLALIYENGSMTGNVTFTAPTTTVGGQALSGTLTFDITVDGEVITTREATPGQAVEVKMKIAKAGMHAFQVIVSSGQNHGVPATLDKWIGLDAPAAVDKLTLTKSDYNNGLLTWQAPTVGIHNGYIDAAALNYTVKCNDDGSIVATGLTECQCPINVSGNTLVTRSYSVIAYCSEVEGLSATAERAYFGKPKQVPFTNDFESEKEFNLWTAVDANDDANSWIYNTMDMCAYYNYSRTQPADDWFFSPPIHLTTAQYYTLTSEISAGMSYYQEKYSIHLAKAPKVEGVFKEIHPLTATEKDGAEARKFYKPSDPFAVEEEGDYYLAYHCQSDANQLRFELHSVALTKGASLSAPAPASDFTMTPGARGAIEATASFTAPTVNTQGQPVGDLIRAELYHGDDLVGTLKDIVAGEKYTITDSKQAIQGFNTYRLYIYNASGKGLPAEKTLWVGYDKPLPPANVLVSRVPNDDEQVFLRWDAVPNVGVNGGYVNPETVVYSVARQSDLVEVYNGKETSCYDVLDFFGDTQSTDLYGVFAKNIMGTGEGGASNDIVVGAPYYMPFEETFGPNTGSSTLWIVGYDPTTRAQFSIPETPSSDEEGGTLCCSTESAAGGSHYISSAKIRVDEDNDFPSVVSFDIMGTKQGSKVELYVSTGAVILPTMKKVATFNCPVNEWTRASYNLRDYAGQDVIFTFNCIVKGKGSVYVDHICVDNNEVEGVEKLQTTGNGQQTSSFDLSGRLVGGKAVRGIFVAPGKKIVR